MAYLNIRIESNLVFNDEQMDVLNKAFEIAQNQGWKNGKESFIESLLFAGSIPHIMRNVKYMYPEAMLATFAGDQFIDRFRPVAKLLSQNTTRTYIDYLIEAQEMIFQGKSEMETYEYFISKLQHLQEDKQ